MTVSIIDSFRKTNQAINTPEGVAQQIIGLEIDPKMNGKAIYGESVPGRLNVLLSDVRPQWRAIEAGRSWTALTVLCRTGWVKSQRQGCDNIKKLWDR